MQLLGVVALVSLIAAAGEFVLMAHRENELVDRFSDSTWWMASQFRAEIQQLHISLASFDGSQDRLDDLHDHYDIVFGRIASVEQSTLEPRPEPMFLDAFADVRAGVMALGPQIDAIRPGDVATARALVPAMHTLELAAGRMTTLGAQVDAGHRGAVRAAVGRANVMFGLTVLLLIASLLLSLRAMQRQAQRLDAARRGSEALSDELTVALAQAQAGARAKSAFLATMSHEIRTPMNGVLGAASLLSHTKLAANQRRWVEIVTASGGALLAQLDDVLDFSGLEAAQVALQQEPVDVRALAEATVRLVEGVATAKAIDLVVVVDPEVPATIVSDRRRLGQIWLNLLTNAVKFTQDGGIVLHVALRRRGARCALRVAVADTGPGIPHADRHRVFHEFTRLERPCDRAVRGTGLGLAISRRLVRALRGGVYVSRAGGGGSVFWMTVPITGADGAGSAPGLRVGQAAIVGSTPLVRWALARLLADEGYAVRAPDDGRPDLALVRSDAAGAGPPARRRLAFGPGSALDVPITAARLRAVLAGSPTSSPTAVPAALPQGAPLNLLVADDDPINREIAASLLGHLGHRVSVASDGPGALAAARAATFDCILLDLHMPGLDGEELARTLRRLPPPLASTRLVAVTADSDFAARGMLSAAGFDAVVIKPVTLERLAEALRPQFREAPADVAAPAAPETVGLPTLDAGVRQALACRLTPMRLAALVGTFWHRLDDTLAMPAGLAGADADRRLHTLTGSAASLGYRAAAAAARDARSVVADPEALTAALADLSAALLLALRADAALMAEADLAGIEQRLSDMARTPEAADAMGRAG